MTFRIIPMSSSHWDTSELDHRIPPSLLEDINQHSDDSMLQDSIFDAYGEPHHRDIQTLNSSFCDLPSLPPGEPINHAHMHDSNPAEKDWKSLSAVRSATKTSPNLRLDLPKGEDHPQDLTSDVFVYGRPNPDGSDNPPPPCPSSILMTYWGEPSSYLWMRMRRERGLPFLSMSRISVNNKSQEKISSDSSSRLMETNLMTSFHITNLWNT